MSLEQEVEVLKRIPLFANVDASKLKLMAFASERLVYDPTQPLFHQGDPGDAAYIIVEGKADVMVKTPSGPLKVAEVGRNDLVGEIAILVDIPRTATVVATERLVTLKLTKDLFLQMITDFPQMAIEIMRVLAQRVESTTANLRQAREALKSAGARPAAG